MEHQEDGAASDERNVSAIHVVIFEGEPACLPAKS